MADDKEGKLEKKVNPGFTHYAGKALHDLVSAVTGLAAFGVVASVIGYGAMSLAYGPYDAGKVVYAQLSGDKSLKHRHIETAKGLYAKRIQKQELDERDMKTFYLELGIVGSEGKKPSEEDVSWYTLLDWIEDND